jgi:PAS domain S-box-containing protein
VPHFIFAKDIDGKFLLVNRATAEVYGTTVEALLNQTDADFAQSAEEAQRFRVDDLAVIDSQRPKVIFEEQITDARGQLHLLHTTKIPFTFSGSATPAILGVSVDITDRIAAETALRDSEERFRQLAENIHEVFWMTSPDRERVLYISPGYEEIWGRTCASVYANPASLIGAVHPDDRGRAADYFERQRRGESAFAEYRIIRPDNTIGWIWDRAFPIRNQLGEVYRMAGIAEDVTDRKQTEEGLQRALAKEKELGELKSRFISMASHEFRTPLTAILSSAEMLDRYSHKLTAERKQHHLLQIQASVKNMTRLLEDVLVIGKAEAGKLEFTPGLLDLEQFCCSLVDELQLGAGTRHRLTLIQRAPCRAVTMDAKLLRQILTNLLSNAIKYSPAGGSIELEVTCQGHEAVFRIADQGIGIPLAAHAHLFETFHRADNVGSIPGTGLGMAIVKNSVDLHRGTIEFSSEVGVGTVFVVRLPAQCDAPLLEANGS